MLVLAFSLFLMPPIRARCQTTYNVNFDGANIDLFGFIKTSATGTFSSTAFDALVTDFSITASQNGADPFTFTRLNSTWGPAGFGSDVSITVDGSTIALSAPTGSTINSANAFLLANTLTNGARENLRIAQDQFGFRTPNPPDTVVFDTVPTPFILADGGANVTPEGDSLLLLGTGLLPLAGLAVWRRRHLHQA
jgi:hypothetical protein